MAAPARHRADLTGQHFWGKNGTAHRRVLEREKELQRLRWGSVHTRGHTPAKAEPRVRASQGSSALTHTRVHGDTPLPAHTRARTPAHTHAPADVHGHTDTSPVTSRHTLAHVCTHTHATCAVPGPTQGLWGAAPASWGAENTNWGGWGGRREPLGLGASARSCCGGLFYNHSKNIIQDEGESRLLRASAGPSRGIYHPELGAPPSLPPPPPRSPQRRGDEVLH